MGIKLYILFFFQIICFSSFEALPLGKNTTLVFEVLQDRNVLRKSKVIKSIWEGEPLTLCDIQKPHESMLANNVFIEFSHVPVLCMVLFDASLRYLQLNTSLNKDTKFNYTEIIDGTSRDTICQKMAENVWITTIDENKKWVSKFNDTMKNENSCQSYCVSKIVNPLCPLALWLDSSVKQVELAMTETNIFKNSGSVKAVNPPDTSFKIDPFTADIRPDHTLPITKQAGDVLGSPSKDIGPNNNFEGKVQNAIQVNNVYSKNGDDQALHNFSQHSGQVFPGHSGQVSNGSKLPYQTDNQNPHVGAIATTQGDTDNKLHYGNTHESSEIDKTKKKPLTKSPSTKSVLLPGTDNMRPNDTRLQYKKTESSLEELKAVKSGLSPVGLLEKAKEPVSAFTGKLNDKSEEIKSQEGRIHKISGGSVTAADQDEIFSGSTQVLGSQKTHDISAPVAIQKTLAPVPAPSSKEKESYNPNKDVQTPLGPESMPFPKPEENASPERENTTDPVAKEKGKTGISKGDTAEITKPLDQTRGSENYEANQAESPELDGDIEEPDDHEDQKKLDDGAMNGQVEDGNHLGSHGDANPPQESEDDNVDIQDIPTNEPRFGESEMEEGSPPKPDPSIRVDDYAGTSDEDDDSQWHSDQGRVTQNDADAGYAHDRFVDAEDSHFFAYFMTMIILCILGYIIFHNKQKILALALEGRVRKGSRRRPSTSGYRKLDSNLEEAVTSNCTGSSVTHVIY